MANHGFVTTRKHLTIEKLGELLREIVDEKLDGKLNVVRSDAQFYIILQQENWFPIWLRTRNKIEIRHSGRGDVAWWISDLLTNELAIRLDGTISDEGVEERWKGTPNKFDTFDAYLDYTVRHLPEESEEPLHTRTVIRQYKLDLARECFPAFVKQGLI